MSVQTQLLQARQGIISPQMAAAADYDSIEPEKLCEGIAKGEIVLPANINHKHLSPMAIGKNLSTKINANIGTSDAYPELNKELKKLQKVLDAGAHAVMDLSTGGDIDATRRALLAKCPVMVGSVPLYQALINASQRGENMVDMTVDDIFGAIETHCEDGIDFITVHCGLTLKVIDLLKDRGRVMDIVSLGGAFMAAWMLRHEKENPLMEQFDRLLEIARKYDVTLSLGDGMRPGCLADAMDAPQIEEMILLGGLVLRAREAGVQVMVEGPGHMPLDQITANMKIEKTLCHGAPFYVFGPLVTDVAPGYDHIVSAIGGAIAASSGADFLCYVTPAEHLGLPSLEDVHDGVIAARIAAHAADIVKGIPAAAGWDKEMAQARKDLNWPRQIELAIDPAKAKAMRRSKNARDQECCTMCGKFCAYKVVSTYLGRSGKHTGH